MYEQVLIKSGMFKGEQGVVVGKGPNGLLIDHTLPPLNSGHDCKNPQERIGRIKSWYNWASLDRVA